MHVYGTFLLRLALCCIPMAPLAAQRHVEPVALYDSLWRALDRRYVYFEEKGIRRDSLYAVYRARIRPRMRAKKLARVLGEMIAAFNDGHTRLSTPYGTFRAAAPARRITTVGAASNQLERITLDNDWLRYGVLDSGRVAYIRLRTVQGKASDFAALPALADSIVGKRGVIVDLRGNTGGDERAAARFAARLAHEPTLYRYLRWRRPEPPHAFTEWEPAYLAPHAPVDFRGRIAVLTDARVRSAAESFVLMLRALPGSRQFGERTGGSSGNPQLVHLAPGWTCLISARQLADLDCHLIEGRGIEPHERVTPTVQAAASGHDPVLEQAVRWLR